MNTTYDQFCVLSNTLFCSDFFKRKAEYEVLCCVSDDSSGGEFISLEK